MEIKTIRNEQTYRATLARVSDLVDLDTCPESPEGEELEIFGRLVGAYEAKRFPIGSPDPIEAIKFRMDQQGLTIKSLKEIIGKSKRAYEVLARKRPLTLPMIRRLNTQLGIPATVMISDYQHA